MRRRLALSLILTFVVLAACQAAPPTPESVARTYADRWQRRDYAGLYALLTPPAQKRITEDAFTKRYGAIADEMTLASLAVTTGASRAVTDDRGKTVDGSVTVPLTVRFGTTRVGDFERDVTLPLVRQEDKTWRVDWTPTAIVPELTGERLVRMRRLDPARGRILARDGRELATFGDGVVVGVVPGQIKDEAGMLHSLAPLVKLSEAEVKRRYQSGQPDWFMPIRTLGPDIPAATVDRLKVIEGVQLHATRVRAYPQHALAAHVVGYVGTVTGDQLVKLEAKGYEDGDVVGQTGLEQTMDDVLGGTFGWRLGVVEKDETPATTLAERAAEPGLDVVTSIDLDVQREAEAALDVEQRGAVVVEDPATGELRAIASDPAFDPNAFASGDAAATQAYVADAKRPLFGRATFGQYPTGSTFKLITSSAALREGVLAVGERVPCPAVWTGYGPQWRQVNHETNDLGLIDLHTALARSCNTFFYELGKRLNDKDPHLLPDTAKSYGLGNATGIDFVYEAQGWVPEPEKKVPPPGQNEPWNPGDATNLAIGQGYLLATPLQMCNYVSAVLNGGTLLKPRLVLRLQKRDGTVTKSYDREVLGTANVRAQDLPLIRDGMRGVVADRDGTAFFPFSGFSVPVLGKSGTAETTVGAPDAWFIGGAPYEAATVAVAALVEEKPGLFTSVDAARIARRALAAALGVKP